MFNFLLFLYFSITLNAETESFKNKFLHLSLGIEYQEYSLIVDGKDRELLYSPNLNAVIVPRITFQDSITLGWAFQSPLTAEEKRLRGESEFNDMRLSFDFKHFRASLYYLQYQGFYIENSHTVDSNFGGFNPEVQLPQLYSRSFGGQVTWIQKPKKFSLKALTTQTEKIKGSSGSLLLGAALSQSRFSNPSEIIPTIIQTDFGTDSGLTSGSFSTVSTKAGYGYATGENWFIGGALQAGPGVTHKTIQFSNKGESSGFIPSLRLEALVAGGYNNENFFVSLVSEVKQDYFFINGSDTSLGTQLISGGLNVGIHLESL